MDKVDGVGDIIRDVHANQLLFLSLSFSGDAVSDQFTGIDNIAFHFAANSYTRLCEITLDAAGMVDSIRGYFAGN